MNGFYSVKIGEDKKVSRMVVYKKVVVRYREEMR